MSVITKNRLSVLRVIDIFNSLLLMSLSLALASKLRISKLFIGSLLESARENDIKSNELKMSITPCYSLKIQCTSVLN